ncbi:hypothetical protein PLICRDRAFT_173721 [Plicaturopsis crispa FD-325 SS-3]|nr:hypothetical protein PLICRDRAFT_173721 [Plicaturopsis crispa FD-325 SS-3]
MPSTRITRSTTRSTTDENPTVPEKSTGATKKRSTATAARKPRGKVNPPLTDAEIIAQMFPPVSSIAKIDHSFERPDLTHAQMVAIDDSITMRVYPWPKDNGETLLIDFVHSDGTRVDGPTDWGFWSIGHHISDTLMPRYGAAVGQSTHFYYCRKIGSYEVRRTDGTVLRKLSFPVQTIIE